MLQEQQGPRHTEILLRKEDNVGGRKALKEKFVEIYEAFFKGDDPSQGQPNFWDQLFLIKVNIPFLERCIILTSEDHLLALKPNINRIFTKCCEWLKDNNTVRLSHILETLSILLKSIFRKKFNNFGFDVLNILCGIENADKVFKDLILDLENLLKTAETKIKVGVINFLNIIATATDFLNQNTLLQYFMVVNIFNSLTDVLLETELPKQTRVNILSLVCYLSNYQKYETVNPYLKGIHTLSSTEKIKAISEVITDELKNHNNFYQEQYREPNAGLMSRFGGYLSSWVYSPTVVKPCTFSETGSCLLILYELFYQNNIFSMLIIDGLATNGSPCPELLKQFIIFSSFLASDTQKESKILFSKLCLTILLCISEKRELEDFFHDVKTTSYIFIYSKKSLYPDPKELEKHPLSYYVVELISQFIKCNLKGKVSIEVHQRAIDCLHRVVSYKKKTQSRIFHKWNDVWASLFLLMGFLPSQQVDKNLLHELIQVGNSAVNILYLFINYGDSFLPSPNDYHDLFYEIIRSGPTIESYFQFIQKNDPNGYYTPNLLNIQAIVTHFTGKLQQWSTEHPEIALTYEQVSKVIRDNYNTLSLKLQENLDQYDPYVENPKDTPFFRYYVKELVGDTKKNIQINHL
eukprot:gene9195-11270_t